MDFSIGTRFYESAQPLLMGILNVTPDSFSDGGRFVGRDLAVEHALTLAEDGADILDIGGESTRPGAEPVSLEAELERVIPVVKALAGKIAIPVSVDTTKAEVAERALDAGAAMVNDISALRFDPRMAEVIRLRGCPVVLMHMQGAPRDMQASPHYENVVEEILAFLRERVSCAVGKGIPREKIIVDPGIGFGKNLEHNLAILRNIGRFHETGCPVLVGASRKAMIGKLTGAPAEERVWGTAAVTAWCVLRGVEIQRVHDVKAMRQVCAVAKALRE
ncbi:MAG: dihydropteroate synthase [Candidatus Latescibacterota bacterium]